MDCLLLQTCVFQVHYSHFVAALKDLLPPAKSSTSSFYDPSNYPWFKKRYSSSEAKQASMVKPNPVPPYLNRKGFVPRRNEDFGDGGAFPEIHIAQHPLGIGRKDAKPGVKNIACYSG
ncbi:hypothetical protein Ancab_035386 [Ancistrocladus abbreviatus]